MPLDLRGEMGVKHGRFGRQGNKGRTGNGVGEIRANFGYESGGDGDAIEDSGDEGGGAAEGLGQNDAILHENVVAVVADDETRSGTSIFDHVFGRIGDVNEVGTGKTPLKCRI